MDISKWLCGTTLSPPPPPSQQAHCDQIDVHATRAHGASSPRSLHRSKRIAPIADSSVIEIPQKTRHAHKRRRHRSRTRSESGESGTSSENDSSSAVSEPSQAESASDEHRKQVHKSYERRPRHKTKPDKYLPKDPKPKKSKSRRNRKKDTKPKKRRRKEHADDAMDLVKNFKTAHVANDRLTLLPNLKSGLYKQGRASVPIRGKGLPDLTFSEMRFLQNPDDNVGVSVEKQISKMRKDKKRREQRLDHEQEISTYFGVTEDRRNRRANPPPIERTPEHHFELQQHIGRHLTDERAAGTRSSSHFHRDSSLDVDGRRPRGESNSGITWPEPLPVGASISTYGMNLNRKEISATKVVNRPKAPTSDHQTGNDQQRGVPESDRPDPRAHTQVQSTERTREPDRTQPAVQEEVTIPAPTNTTVEGVDGQKPAFQDDRQPVMPHRKDHVAVTILAEKSSSSPLTKALKGCERALDKAAQSERASPCVLRPHSPPSGRTHECDVFHRQYYDRRPDPYTSATHPTRSTYTSRQQSAPHIVENAFLYEDLALGYGEAMSYPYACILEGFANDMRVEESAWDEEPLVQEELIEYDVDPWPDEPEMFDQYQDTENMVQDREVVNEAEDGTVLAGFWKPNRLY